MEQSQAGDVKYDVVMPGALCVASEHCKVSHHRFFYIYLVNVWIQFR